jgi:hypothetical protein
MSTQEERTARAKRLRRESLHLLSEQPQFLDQEMLDRMDAYELRRAQERAPLPPPLKPVPVVPTAAGSEILYRSFAHNPGAMDDTTAAGWNAWLAAAIEEERTAVATATGEYIAEQINELRRELTKKFDAEMASLRSEQRVATAEAEARGARLVSDTLREVVAESRTIDATPKPLRPLRSVN